MFRSTVWALCLIWMTNAIGAHAAGKRAKTHPCDINNGGCDQLCIRNIKDNKIFRCDCLAEGDYMLMNDKKSCKKRPRPGDVLTVPKGKFYVAVAEKKTWDQARATCQNVGGDLAQIRTVEDQKAVGKFLRDNWPFTWPKTTSTEWWIGAKRDGSKKRKWKWVNGDKVSTDIPYNWDKSGLGHMAEKCFSIHRDLTYAFCAGDCTNAKEFVCEYHSQEGVLAGVLAGVTVTDTMRMLPRGKFYVAVAEKRTWDQARATCQKMGGDLAQIRTVDDQKHVAKFITDNFTTGYSGTGTEWWIGALKDIDRKRKWRWVDGDKVSTDIAYKWDESSLRNTNEKCLSIRIFTSKVSKFFQILTSEFYAGTCHDAWKFVCEIYRYF